MALSTLVTRLNIPAPIGLKGPKMIPLRSDGLPKLGLQNLFKFNETDLTNGVLDEVGNTLHIFGGTAPDANNSNLPASGGGGIVLKGWRNLIGPTVDTDKPFTLIMAATPTPPASAPTSQQTVFTVGQIDVCGLWSFRGNVAPDPFTIGYPLGIYAFRQNGATGSVSALAMEKPWVAKWGKVNLIALTHDGNSNFTFVRVNGGLIDRAGFVADKTALRGNPASPQSPIMKTYIGGTHVNAIKGTDTFDMFAIYTHKLSDDEIMIIDGVAKAQAALRGRT